MEYRPASLVPLAIALLLGAVLSFFLQNSFEKTAPRAPIHHDGRISNVEWKLQRQPEIATPVIRRTDNQFVRSPTPNNGGCSKPGSRW